MSRFQSDDRLVTDYGIAAKRGFLDGVTTINKFGNNPDIDNSAVFETIWNGGNTYTGFNATGAEKVRVSSTNTADTAAGAGARTIEIFGLDANFVEQNETITMDGTSSGVQSVNSYIRLNRAIVRTAGSSNSNQANVTIKPSTTVANIFCVMPAGYNETMICAYTVPADKVGFMTDWFATVSGRVSANSAVRFIVRPEGETFQVKEEIGLRGAGNSIQHRNYTIPKGPFNAKTDIKVEANSDTQDTNISAGFDLIMYSC